MDSRNAFEADNTTFNRIILLTNEHMPSLAAICAFSFLQLPFAQSASIVVVASSNGMASPRVIIPAETLCSNQPSPNATASCATNDISGVASVFSSLCSHAGVGPLMKRVSFLVDSNNGPDDAPHFLPDFQKDLYIYISLSGTETARVGEHRLLRSLELFSISKSDINNQNCNESEERGGGRLVVLSDAATQLSAWGVAKQLRGWQMLGICVSEFSPPFFNPHFTRASLYHSDIFNGLIESVSLGVAFGTVKHVPFSFREPVRVVPLDLAANLALVAASFMFAQKLSVITGSKGNEDVIIHIDQDTLIWGMLAEYLMDYFGRFNKTMAQNISIPQLLDRSSTLQVSASVSDWLNYGISLMRPFQGYYAYTAQQRRRRLISYRSGSTTSSLIRSTLEHIDKTLCRINTVTAKQKRENALFKNYFNVIKAVSDRESMRHLLPYISLSSIKWDTYIKTVAQTTLEVVVGKIINFPIRFPSPTPLYHNDIVFNGKRRSPAISLTPRKYFTDIHWALRCGMSSKGVRVETIPGISKARKSLILEEPSVRQAMEKEVAQSKHHSKEIVRQRSEAILRSIGDTLNQFQVRLFGLMVRKTFFALYEEINVNESGFARLFDLVRTPRTQVVLIPAHRSYMDFLILTYMLVVMGLSPPHVCAGDDFLRMGPIAKLMRGSGAFFMRRTLRGDLLYYTIFREYVRQLVLHCQLMEFFIEGMRSRSGKMLCPKLGILKFITDTFFENQDALNDIYFVPVSFSYDELLEAKLYANEQLGVSKPKESIGNLFRARSLLKERHGSINVHIGEKLSLREFRDNPYQCPTPLESSVQVSNDTSSPPSSLGLNRNKPSTPPQVLTNLAWHICRRLEDNTVVTPGALLATVLNFCAPPAGITLNEAHQQMEWLRTHMVKRKVALSADCNTTDAATLTQRALNHLSPFVELDASLNVKVRSDTCSQMGLSIYTNQLIHVFLDEGVLVIAARTCGEVDEKSNSVLIKVGVLKENCRRLHTLLATEFPRYLSWCPYTMESWLRYALDRLETMGTDDADWREEDDDEVEEKHHTKIESNSTTRHTSHNLHHDTNNKMVLVENEGNDAAVVQLRLTPMFHLLTRLMTPFVESLYLMALEICTVSDAGEAEIRKGVILTACQKGGLAMHDAGEFALHPQSYGRDALRNALDAIASVSGLENDVNAKEPIFVVRGESTPQALSARVQPLLTQIRTLCTALRGMPLCSNETGARHTLLDAYKKQLAQLNKPSKI